MSQEILTHLGKIDDYIRSKTNGGEKDFNAEITFGKEQAVLKLDLIKDETTNIEVFNLEKNIQPSSDLLS